EEGEVASVVPRDVVVRLPFIGGFGMAPYGQFHLDREGFQQVAVGQQILHAHTVAGRKEDRVGAGSGWELSVTSPVPVVIVHGFRSTRKVIANSVRSAPRQRLSAGFPQTAEGAPAAASAPAPEINSG